MENLIRPDFSQVAREVNPSEKPKEMLSVLRDGAQTTVRINSSSLSVIQTCARKTQYSLFEGWRGKHTSPPLVFGQAIHKALEVFYSHPKQERTIPADFDDVAPLLAHGHNTTSPHFLYEAVRAFVEAGEPLKMLPDTDTRSLSSGIWVLSHYFRTYLNDQYVIHSDEQGPLTERRFEYVLYEDRGLRIILFGTIDFVLRNLATGEILPGDHKTSSQMGIPFLNRIKPNHQYTGYLIGAREVLGLTTENFLVNGIQVKARPLTSRGGPPTFTRQVTRRTAEDFAEFRDVVRWSVESYLRWEKSGVWPLGVVDACSNWGGCNFLDVCQAPNELRKNILEAKYVR